MFPKIETPVNCLESLVGIRTICGATPFPMYFEDIEGVDIRRLAAIAKGSNMTGQDFAKQIINSAARELLADIELIMNNGYKLKSVLGNICSSCSLLPSYTPGGGITITSNVYSSYSFMNITQLTILINQTGPRTLVIDDGITTKLFTPTFTAGVKLPVLIDYTTNQRTVKIYFQDATIGVGQVSCTTTGGCGCGSAQPSAPVSISGILNGAPTSTQYGFLPCVGVVCSYETLVCNMIKQTPNIFALTLFYKVGEKYYLHRHASERNNETASYNEEQPDEYQRNYSGLYGKTLQGTGQKAGLRSIINQYLRTNANDYCVQCEAKIYTAGARG